MQPLKPITQWSEPGKKSSRQGHDDPQIPRRYYTGATRRPVCCSSSFSTSLKTPLSQTNMCCTLASSLCSSATSSGLDPQQCERPLASQMGTDRRMVVSDVTRQRGLWHSMQQKSLAIHCEESHHCSEMGCPLLVEFKQHGISVPPPCQEAHQDGAQHVVLVLVDIDREASVVKSQAPFEWGVVGPEECHRDASTHDAATTKLFSSSLS